MTLPITIVSGLPRSGTSMMMQMLVAAGLPPLTDDLRQADADNPRGYLEYEPVKQTRADPAWLAAARGKVVKMVHILLLDLPAGYDYRIVMMQRDLDEVIASQFKMLERSGRPRPGLPPETLKRVLAAQMDSVRRFIASRAEIRLLEVSYNTMLDSAHAEAERIAAFLELGPGAADRMIGTIDPSLYRNRKG
jgi:hypothetical protein